MIYFPILFAFFRPFFHKRLVFNQFRAIGFSLLLHDAFDKLHFLVVCLLRCFKQGFLGHVERQSALVRKFLLACPDVFAPDCRWWDGFGQLHRPLKLALQNSVHLAVLQVGHRVLHRIVFRNSELRASEFNLIQ